MGFRHLTCEQRCLLRYAQTGVERYTGLQSQPEYHLVEFRLGEGGVEHADSRSYSRSGEVIDSHILDGSVTVDSATIYVSGDDYQEAKSLRVEGVELHSAVSTDYDKLHDEMESEGFTRTWKADGGTVYQLPTAEYDYRGEKTRLQVLELAKKAAKATF